MRFTFKVLLLLLILISGIAGIAIYTTFFTPLPDYNERFTMDGLAESVDVHWDPYGVPFITAETEEDLYFVMGYLHAQERLWQLTLHQLRAEGRFAEFLGEDFLDADRFIRTMGFWETAKKIEQETPDSLITILQHYANGINRYVELNKKRLPPQFVLLDIEPILWTPTHSIAASRLIAWEANIHWLAELTYSDLARRLTDYQFQQLIPEYDDEMLSFWNRSASIELAGLLAGFVEADEELRKRLGGSVSASGSNAWALSGEKTASGLPLLAGDIHSNLYVPGPWFDVTHSTPRYQISGATFPGIPFIVQGQNRDYAWATTSIYADDTDFFLERLSEESPDYYLRESTQNSTDTLSFQKRREIIKVRDADDRLHVVRTTRHGPVISDLGAVQSPDEEWAISIRWTGHDISQELLALYEMNRSSSIEQFRNAAAKFKVPGTNFIYADKNDNIALFSALSVPIRDFNPLAYRHGWDPDYDWSGYVPFDELPHQVNPENGFVAHANNRFYDEGYPHYIGTFWEPSFRIRRISDQLSITDEHDSRSMQELQFDVLSEQAREITELILPLLRNGDQNERMEIAINYLENWNFQYQAASTASSVFDLFMVHLSENTFRDEIGEDAFEKLSQIGHLPPAIITRMLNENSLLFDNSTTPEIETREQIVRTSMLQTVDNLAERYGEEPYSWTWENVVTFHINPPMLTEMADDSLAATSMYAPVIRNLFTQGPFTVRGNPMTVNKMQYRWEFPFSVLQGASIRRITDFSESGRSLSILPTGQSGNPLSEFYSNQTDLWLEGRYRYIYRDSSFFDQTSYKTTRLIPEND